MERNINWSEHLGDSGVPEHRTLKAGERLLHMYVVMAMPFEALSQYYHFFESSFALASLTHLKGYS